MAKTSKTNPKSTTDDKKIEGFSDFERSALRERAMELRASKADGETLLLAKIAEMPEPDKSLATKIHAIVTATAPHLKPKTWYGMPAYANQDGKVVCFFQSAVKYQARYCTLGFNDQAKLDDGDMWATGFAVKKITPAIEDKITALVKKAAA